MDAVCQRTLQKIKRDSGKIVPKNSVKNYMLHETALNSWPRGEIDFLQFPDCEQQKLVVRLSYDEVDAFRERYVDARATIHAFYNELSMEEETPNTFQYEGRQDQSRADNDKQQTENGDDEYPIASSRSHRRGRVPAEQFVVAHVRLKPERKRIAQSRNNPDQLVDQDIHRHAREQNFRNTTSRCVNKRHRRNYCGGHVSNSRKQTDNWIQAKAAFCPGNAQEIIHDERKPSKKGFKRGTRAPAAGSVFGRQKFPLRNF
jgi:hypothetical protein